MLFGRQKDGSFVIRASCIGELHGMVAKLNGRVKRVGGVGLAVEEVERGSVIREVSMEEALYSEVYQGRYGARISVAAVRVRVLGEVPRVAGWSFVARVDHVADGVNVVCRAPGMEGVVLPEELWRASAKRCDHCGVSRDRIETHVLQSEGGELRRVGSTCLKDFLRSDEIEQALAWYKLIDALQGFGAVEGDEYGSAVRAGSEEVGVLVWLACVMAAIRQWGWVSAKQAEERGQDSTRMQAMEILLPPGSKAPPSVWEAWRSHQPQQEDQDEAVAALAWVRALAPKSDFEQNLRAACFGDWLSAKHFGIAAAAIPSYRRDQDKAIKARSLPRADSWVGAEGKREVFTLTCVKVMYFEGDYGTKTMAVFAAKDGSCCKWFASGYKQFREGAVYRGKATVKKHERYKGAAETLLSRCAFEEVPAA